MHAHYRVGKKYTVPYVVVCAIASWAIALLVLTVAGLIIWFADAELGFDSLNHLPKALSLAVGLLGAYAAIGSICLYVTMWFYWFGMESSGIGQRIAWLLVLIFLVHYGALFYSFVVWKTKVEPLSQEHPADLAITVEQAH
jgi:hypothetical protein